MNTELLGWVSLALFSVVFLIIILLTTPALTFFLAKFRKRVILIRENADKTIEYIPAERKGNLAITKDGYYLIYPEHVFIDPITKVPCFFVYSRYSVPINLKDAKVAEKLSELGIKNYADVLDFFKKLRDEGKTLVVKLLGESVDVSKVVDYFSNAPRADWIRGEIENRVAAEVIKRTGAGDLLKWAVFIMIILIGAGIAYVAISGGGHQIISSLIPSATPQPQPRIVTPTTIPSNVTTPQMIS
jgi:hypothetical protein